mmetsp:Transcript_139143/g.444516  ORF Transcript_139143/g.444516 Transcript_139143/m.444516 type:complete len:245 (+) Transcript_139143:4175-4909(+)
MHRSFELQRVCTTTRKRSPPSATAPRRRCPEVRGETPTPASSGSTRQARPRNPAHPGFGHSSGQGRGCHLRRRRMRSTRGRHCGPTAAVFGVSTWRRDRATTPKPQPPRCLRATDPRRNNRMHMHAPAGSHSGRQCQQPPIPTASDWTARCPSTQRRAKCRAHRPATSPRAPARVRRRPVAATATSAPRGAGRRGPPPPAARGRCPKRRAAAAHNTPCTEPCCTTLRPELEVQLQMLEGLRLPS